MSTWRHNSNLSVRAVYKLTFEMGKYLIVKFFRSKINPLKYDKTRIPNVKIDILRLECVD